MRRTASGWFFTVTGFLACPCHLVVTLPLAVAVLSGTALGGWIAAHEGSIAVGAGIYFVGALVVGMLLLTARRATARDAACALPAPPAWDALPYSSDSGNDSGVSRVPGRPGCCPPRSHLAGEQDDVAAGASPLPWRDA